MRPVNWSIEEYTRKTRPATASHQRTGSTPRSAMESFTVHGRSTSGLPASIPCHAAAAARSGVMIGVSSGPRAPANIPVDT